MKDITSPQSFIDFGFYYIIAAALQRRVWCGPDHKPLYPNIYPILVGPPGVGKGLVVKEVEYILRFHELEDPTKAPVQQKDPSTIVVDPAVIEAMKLANYAQATNGDANKKDTRRPMLIPMAANATTFEALVRAMSRATRRINYPEWDEKMQKDTLRIYTHCSLAFCLEEISSLFRKHTEDVVNFLITAYDCGNYEYDTKTQGCDIVQRCCLNFFGGTTPSFMETTFNDRLLNDGFASRAWFIVEQKNRFDKLTIPPLSSEQKQARQDLVDHVKLLSKLYGNVEYEHDAWEYLRTWWENPNRERANRSPKLDYYYSRKNIHVQKLAQCLHFGEDAAMCSRGRPKNKITLATAQQAMSILHQVELNMHLALNFDANNPLAAVSKKIINYIKRNGPQSTLELRIEFWGDVDKDQLDAVLHNLNDMKKVQFDTTTNKWNVT